MSEKKLSIPPPPNKTLLRVYRAAKMMAIQQQVLDEGNREKSKEKGKRRVKALNHLVWLGLYKSREKEGLSFR